MGLIETRPPTGRELAFFGAVPALFLGVVGALVAWQLEALNAAVVLWCTGLALCLVYFAVPPVRLLMYYTWMKLMFPIGWTISHLLLAIAYYLALAPIGFVMRLFGRDPLRRRRDPSTPTYWIEYNPGAHPERYLRQF